MNERLLQFIWQFRYFNTSDLQLYSGESFRIIHPGQLNKHQGPDFLEARIQVGSTLWVGSVELHLKTSGWKKHAHSDDSNYDNVILHVVWENDEPDPDPDMGLFILEDRVSKLLLKQYESWMDSPSFIPCESQLSKVKSIVWENWKERLLVERLLRKSAQVRLFLEESNHHWEESFWWMLARNMGIKVNADAFESIARTIPLKLLGKHKKQIHQLEALLFGQAGLLNRIFVEDYPMMLYKEYQFLQNKYKLRAAGIAVHYLRMRPVNFPTIRLAQLAMLIHESSHLFSRIKDAQSYKDIKEMFSITANDYWHYHYVFDETSSFNPKKIGDQMINNILINTVIPFLFTYGDIHKENSFKQRAMKWLEEIGPDVNSVTNGFQEIGIPVTHARDTQALMELKTKYCDQRRCLDCAVGNALLGYTSGVRPHPNPSPKERGS
jgi:uncharacterized protein DUF2851